MNDLDKKGIYKIFNLETGDYYIGSTTLFFSKRLTQHISDLHKNKHRNIHLQRAFNKFGWQNFVFVIIEIIDNTKDIIKREQFYLDQNPRYNIAKIADNNAKGRKATPEQRKRLSEITRGRPAWNKGKTFSEESRLKMSNSMKGRIPNNKGKIGVNFNPIVRSDGVIFNNPTLAAIELNIKPNTIISAIKRGNKCQGFTFKYLDKEDT